MTQEQAPAHVSARLNASGGDAQPASAPTTEGGAPPPSATPPAGGAQPPSPLTPADEKRAIMLLALAAFVSSSAFRICDAMLPQLALDFNTTTGGAAHVVTAFAIAY